MTTKLGFPLKCNSICYCYLIPFHDSKHEQNGKLKIDPEYMDFARRWLERIT